MLSISAIDAQTWPGCRLEEGVIDVSGRDQAEHEEAQHDHNLLLHRGKNILVYGKIPAS